MTPHDEPGDMGIGELAERAGTSVKTVRFHADRGLLPRRPRTPGGHRRFGDEALHRLRTIRGLRALDVPVPDIERAVKEEDALRVAVARRLTAVKGEPAALRRRESALRLVEESGASAERADRLAVLAAAPLPPTTTELARSWRRRPPSRRLPRPLAAAIVDAAVRTPAPDPAPGPLLAYARLHALARTAAAPAPPARDPGCDPVALYEGLGVAHESGAAAVAAGRTPGPGPALDAFVTAHADAQRTRNSADFRRRLRTLLARTTDRAVDRYGRFAAAVDPAAPPTMGAAHDRLGAALRADPGPSAEAGRGP
ncbi:MerR family transcriptional regulator [Streptomyces sp. NPDC102406]|uniref:helix-turn-helix domain-containing protein n=1 Tax=Streptomyces sp. NPDC102406 TaxID=3366171 RepID=UPI00380C650B